MAVAVFAQQQVTRLAFEVASIKPNTSGGNSSTSKGTKDRIVITNWTLKRLIERAYNVNSFQVAGPEWIKDVHFDITAKYPPETKKDDYPLMLRTLLEERFQLAMHRESKEMSGYVLLTAKSGFKLKPVEPGGADTNSRGGRVQTLTVKKISMAMLADLMSRNLSQMVIDKTAMPGVYDFELTWSNDNQLPSGNNADTAPSLFTALQETLGVRLQGQKIPVEIIVVDQIARIPTEN